MAKTIKIIMGSMATLAFLIAGYFFLDSLLFDGVNPVSVNDNGVQATFFAKEGIENQPAVVLVGGGVWGDYWGQEFAKANYVGLSVAYVGKQGLPALLEEIPLEYFDKAMDWLKEQPEVNPDKLIVMGASRNAELALVVASHFPETVKGAIAYAPSSVAWSNTVHSFNSDSLKPSWTFEQKPVPYIPMEKLKGGKSDTLETLSYWAEALSDSTNVSAASIQVEKIQGPILLLSGLDDHVWPAARMSDRIENRLKNRSFNFEVENIQYENAGHLISGNPNYLATTRHGTMMIEGKRYTYSFGGTAEGDMAAQKDASARVFQFLSKLNDE